MCDILIKRSGCVFMDPPTGSPQAPLAKRVRISGKTWTCGMQYENMPSCSCLLLLWPVLNFSESLYWGLSRSYQARAALSRSSFSSFLLLLIPALFLYIVSLNIQLHLQFLNFLFFSRAYSLRIQLYSSSPKWPSPSIWPSHGLTASVLVKRCPRNA